MNLLPLLRVHSWLKKQVVMARFVISPFSSIGRSLRYVRPRAKNLCLQVCMQYCHFHMLMYVIFNND